MAGAGPALPERGSDYDIAPDGAFLMIRQADTLRQILVVVD